MCVSQPAQVSPLRCESNVFNTSGVPDPAFPDVKWLVVVMVVDVTVLLVDEVVVHVVVVHSARLPGADWLQDVT